MAINVIESVAAYLEDQGHGTVGTTIFKYRMPPSPDNCILISPAGGAEGLRYIELDYPDVQVRVRNTHPASGYTILKSIYTTLHGMHATVFGGVIVTDCYGVQSQPTFLDIDEKQRTHYFIEFEMTTNR